MKCIKKIKEHYYLNYENKMVVCVLTAYVLGVRVSVAGRSKCSNDDVFDPTVGKRIAESRAKTKLFKKTLDLLEKIKSQHQEILGITKECIKKYTFSYEREQKHTEILIENTNE